MKIENLRTVALSEILDLPVHPVADLFPLLPVEVRKEDGKLEMLTLPELADSILEDGLLEPIVLFEGKLLDGRNRRAGCVLVADALELLPEEYRLPVTDFIGTDEDADKYVLARNVRRRDLSPGQRAFVAVGYWELRSPGQGARTDQQPLSTLAKVDTAEDLSQLFCVSRSYIVSARRIAKEIEDGRKQAELAAQEAESQRAIAKQKTTELEAANTAQEAVADEVARAALRTTAIEASRAASRAANAAAEAAEKASEKATQAAHVANRADKVRAGKATMNSLAKPPKPEVNDTDPTVKFRNKINTAMGTFKQAVTELAAVSAQGVDDYHFVGRKITDMIDHFESEFGLQKEEE